jgi:hypothetical protein
MGVLTWARPAKVMTDEEWRAISADSAPPGVYVPNMSDADQAAWKAKAIRGKDPRVEIRKTARGTQVLIIVRPGPQVRMSMNGPAEFTPDEWHELGQVVAEAAAVLGAQQ